MYHHTNQKIKKKEKYEITKKEKYIFLEILQNRFYLIPFPVRFRLYTYISNF